MKRIIKNVISIFIVIIMGLLMYFTMNYIRKQSNHSISNDITTSSSKQTQQQPSSTQPSAPSKSDITNDKTPVNKSESDPSGVAPSTTSAQNINESVPNDELVYLQSSMYVFIYYFMFATESLVLSLVVVYMIMSCFSKKTFGQTFSGAVSIVTFIVSVIVMTVSVTIVDKVITEKYFLSESIVSATEKALSSNNSSNNIEVKNQNKNIENEKKEEVKAAEKNVVNKNEADKNEKVSSKQESNRELPYAIPKEYAYKSEETDTDDYAEYYKPIEEYNPKVEIKIHDNEQNESTDEENNTDEKNYGLKRRESSYIMLN